MQGKRENLPGEWFRLENNDLTRSIQKQKQSSIGVL